jgi:hypothetical protein
MSLINNSHGEFELRNLFLRYNSEESLPIFYGLVARNLKEESLHGDHPDSTRKARGVQG